MQKVAVLVGTPESLCMVSQKEAGTLQYSLAVVYLAWAPSLRGQTHDHFHLRWFAALRPRQLALASILHRLDVQCIGCGLATKQRSHASCDVGVRVSGSNV